MIVQIILASVLIILLLNTPTILRYIRIWYFAWKLPGPKALPIIGPLLMLAFTADTDIIQKIQKYLAGRKLISVIILGKLYSAVVHPPDLERLLGNTHFITKGSEYNSTMLWLKEGLLTSTGAKWHQRRKILTPSFHFKILQDCLHAMNEHADKLTKKLSTFNNEAVDVERFVTLCTLDIICETAMGIKLNSQDNQAEGYVNDIKRVTELIWHLERSPWLWNSVFLKLSPTGRELFPTISRLHDFTNKVISERKKLLKDSKYTHGGKTRMAFLDCLLDAEAKNPGTFSDDDIREEVDTFMFEGHDTVSVALVYCLMILGEYKDVQERAVEELTEIFGASDRPATSTDLQQMRYLEMVIKESLRLYPSVPIITRSMTSDLHLEDGNIIPEGSDSFILPYLIHRDSKIYDDPERFIPERFTEENSKNRHPFAYLPFSAGPRNCIGQKFAMMELKVVLSTVLRQCRLESITTRKTLKVKPFLILRPEKPIQMKFYRKYESE